MSEERPACHDSDVAPFGSAEHTLAHGGPFPQELELNLRDRDVLLVVELDDTHARALHLQNVREDTLTEAKAAVDKFLNQMGSLTGNNSGRTVFQMYDRIHDQIAGPVDVAVGDIDELMSKLTAIDNDEVKYPKEKSESDLNPVAEITAACSDFLERVRSIQSKSNSSSNESQPKRDASVLTRALDSTHKGLEDYMEKEALKRSLGFNWYTPSYPEQRKIKMQPKYRVYYDADDECWRHVKGSYAVPPWSIRGQESA